ncbi:very-long-chain 3-oxoacyl-CoA reductase [Favolaschia claudopus]|uniref:Very-long-chain 3-oxoacyl-CoA reductase n=1 Tax=Favolaschia claudopus TaxID=2862362 RepID=A0AAV9ZCN5_9AGAR
MDALQPILDDVQSFLKTSPWWLSALVALGSLGASRFAYQTLSVLLQTLILPGTNLKRFGAKKGAWAVVTGASDGIGKEFAMQLASRGFNVLLVARNTQLLNSVASDILAKYPSSKTDVHTIDFAAADDSAYEALSTRVDGLDVGILVNNVGKSHAMPAYLVDTPLGEMEDIVKINVGATLRVTYATLPGMIRRKRGLVLNIGTKAFLATFTSALAEEVRKNNIVVEHVNTYFVTSKLSKIRRASAMIPTPKAYVRSVLSKIGLGCGAAYGGRPGTSTPYWSHAMLEYYSGSNSQAFLAKWSLRSLALLLLIGVFALLDRIKDRWYVFDPVELNALANAAIAHASAPNDTSGMIQYIVANLTSTYPSTKVHINANSGEWLFNNAGGAMGALYIIHASLTEYLFIFGTPLGTEGHTGLLPADDYFNILVGEQWAFSPGQLDMERYTPGMVHYLPRGTPKQYKMHRGCFALEYARGWIPLMVPFGLADGLTSTLDFFTLYKTAKITVREMGRNLLVGKI